MNIEQDHAHSRSLAAGPSSSTSFSDVQMDVDPAPSPQPGQHSDTYSAELGSGHGVPTSSGTRRRPCRVVVEDVPDEDDNLLEPEPDGIYDGLGGPEDSEPKDELYLDDDEQDKFSRAARRRDAALPEHLRGLSASQILQSDWRARAFTRGQYLCSHSWITSHP